MDPDNKKEIKKHRQVITKPKLKRSEITNLDTQGLHKEDEGKEKQHTKRVS